MEKFTDSLNDFALKLFKEVANDERSSFLSPASITMALAMTYTGAEGKTKSQIKQVMFAGLGDGQINESLNKVVKALLDLEANDLMKHHSFSCIPKRLASINEPTDAYVLHTVNRLYIEKLYKVLQSYLDVMRKNYHADCISCNFKEKPQEVRQEINSWVEKTTHDKIKDLLPDNAIDKETRLILVNAIYFKGDWKEAFVERKTEMKPFHVSQSKQIDVETMHGEEKMFKFAANEKCQILGLPYKTKDLTMFFVLPTERHGLQALEKELTGSALIKLLRTVYTTGVEVQLPKFKLEQSFDLVQQLKELGMCDMFTDAADFSKITASKDLMVTGVVHKAFIEVNEKGTEAAAVTVQHGYHSRCASPILEHHFIADHPFLFAIVECKTNSILFLGHYYGL